MTSKTLPLPLISRGTTGTKRAFWCSIFNCSLEVSVRFIPTTVHGFADYLVGLTVIALPFLLGSEGAARVVLIALGIFVLLYSLVTDYELGAIRFLRIRFHLLLDALFGIVMLVLPLTLDTTGTAQWPFFVFGILALALVFTTRVRAEATAA